MVNAEMEDLLNRTVLNSTPVKVGYDTSLWTNAILANLLKQAFDVMVSKSKSRLHKARN